MAARKPTSITAARAARTSRAKQSGSVRSAAEDGSRRDLLVAMRGRIATAIDSPATPPRDLAALTRRLLDISKEIESLDAEERRDDVGDAAATPDEGWPAT